MKLTHIAQVLTLALLVVTTYLAFQARDESVKSRAVDDQRSAQMSQQLQAIAAQNASVVTLPPPMPSPVPAQAPVAAPAPAPRTGFKSAGSTYAGPLAIPEPRRSTTAASSPAAPRPASKTFSDAPPSTTETASSSSAPVPAMADVPLTPLQRRVKASPAIGKVVEFQSDQGFVVLSAGTKQGLKIGMTLDLRRDASVVGRITLTTVEESEAVADVDFKSVPAGVTVQPGDEVIGVVLAP